MESIAPSLLTLLAIALACYAVGQPLQRGLGPPADAPGEATVWAIAWGLVAWGLALAGLGIVGLLYAPTVGVATLAAACAGAGMLYNDFRLSPAAFKHLVDETSTNAPQHAYWPRLLAVAALVIAGAAWLVALLPPTAGDALCYHLELPKRFLQTHTLNFDPYADNCTFPLLAEMWFLWALALDSGVAAQLVHWGLGLLLAAASYLLARPVLGSRLAWAVGGLVLLVPGVNNQMSVPLNDVACAAFATLGLAGAWRLLYDDQAERWRLATGMALGAACSIKYTALLLLASLVVVGAAQLATRPKLWQNLLRHAAVVAVVAITVASVWYVRAGIHRGNPVWPFFEPMALAAEVDDKTPLGKSPLAIVMAPWHMTMQPEQFGGRGHQFGPLALMCLPGLLIVRRVRGLGPLLGVAAVYFAGCCLLRQNVRFLLPVAAPLLMGVAWVLFELARLPGAPRRLAWTSVILVCALLVIAPLKRARTAVEFLASGGDRAAWLARHEPTWPVAEVANSLLPADARLFSQEHRAFYIQPAVVRENIYRRQTSYHNTLTAPTDLAERLHDDGFTHLLLARSLWPGGTRYDATLWELAHAALADEAGGLELVCDLHGRAGADTPRHYRLLKIRPSTNQPAPAVAEHGAAAPSDTTNLTADGQ